MFTENAKWIGIGEGSFKTGNPSPAIELRKTFTLHKTPDSAECLILGLGSYVLFINGKRVGTDVLSPAFTAYDKRALYLRYDLKDYLTKGENVIAVKLGDGFYNQTVADEWNFYLADWRNLPRMLFELFLDGECALASDTTWKCRTSGATVHNAIRTGEYYDARLDDGWKNAGYCDTGWDFAKTVNPAGGIIEEQIMPPQRECETLKAIDRWETENGWIFDFGKNIAGYVGIKCEGIAGDTMVIRYSEKLAGKELDQSQIDYFVKEWPFSEDHYTFRGEGVEEWKPEFVFHGFRYAEIRWGKETPPALDAITAYFVHTDLDIKGGFSCSDELMSWIYDSGLRAFLSNYQGISLDCPHREKNGWTGDAVISADYAVCLFDMKESYRKWLKDMVDAQRKTGQLPGIVPTSSWGYNWGSGPAWDMAMFALPYALYLETGDSDCLDTVYSSCERYLEYAGIHEDSDGLVCYGLSDWCPPRKLGELNIMPNRFSDSCYYYAMCGIASKAAELHKESGKAARYLEKAHTIKEKIKEIYATDEQIKSHGQGALAFLLHFGIVEGERADEVAKRLVELMKEDNYVHKVGILGMKALPNALSAHGYTDIAYKTLMRYDYPSYGYWKNLGETTLCEVWEDNESRNHHMYADVVNWMIRNVAGLQNRGIAYDKAAFVPYFFAEDCSASAHTKTPRGEISIAWEKKGGKFTADIKIPDGCEATLELPNGSFAAKTGRVEIVVGS